MHPAFVRWRHEERRWALHPTMLPWIGWGFPVRTPGNDKQASSVLTCGGPARPKKPVRRCFKPRPPLRAGYAGFASGCRLGVSRTRSFSGGCPASCPDAHQPARDHRHVRNWAGIEIGRFPPDHKTFSTPFGEIFSSPRVRFLKGTVQLPLSGPDARKKVPALRRQTPGHPAQKNRFAL